MVNDHHPSGCRLIANRPRCQLGCARRVHDVLQGPAIDVPQAMSRPPRFRWPRVWALVVTPALLASGLLLVTGCPPGSPSHGNGGTRERENAPKLLSVQFDD